MTITKVLHKVFSVTLSVCLLTWSSGLAFATNVSTWATLKTDVQVSPGEYNVTTALTADEDSGSQEGTIVVTANGTAITGASLTQNSTNDPLFQVGSSVSSFSVANSLGGSIVNNGTMTYTGSSLSSGNITGSGKFIFGGTTTNANNITQTEVATTSAANVANNANITAKLTNVGTVTGTGAITLTDASSNSGSITQNNFTTAGFNLTNTGAITTNNAFSNESGTISGSGSTLTFAAGTATNSGTITQDSLVNAATFTNTGDVTATLTNTEAISGAGNLYLTGASSNTSTISQTLVSMADGADTLDNSGSITAQLANVGTVTGTGAIVLADVSTNSGNITQDDFDTNGNDLTNDGVITTNNSFANTAAITGDGLLSFDAGTVTNSGTITQDSLVNAATFTNTGDVTATLTNTEAISGAGNLYLNGASSNTSTISQTLLSLANSADKLDNSGIITTELFNAGEITGDGTIFLNADSTNNGTITQGLVSVLNDSNFANNGMLLANAYVADGSSMDSNANNLGKDVENDGTLNLVGDGTLSVKVTGTGSTFIDDVLDNSGSIDQTYIQVKTGSIVTTNASHFTADNSGAANTGIENLGTIHFTAGSTANNIYGTGRMDITGYVTNNGDIEQDIVTNSGVFTNNGDVTANFKNTDTVEGTGTIVTGSGISLNNGSITQDYLENNGTFDNSGYLTLSDELVNYGLFNTNADLVTAANGIENEGTLVFTGGQNYNSINGTVGEVAFTGDATNGGIITQAHVANTANLRNTGTITATSIYNTGTLTTLGDSVSGAVENLGTYVISDHDNANSIIGAGGTTTILGDTTNTGIIMQETLKIANSGNLTTDADLVTASITNDGKLTWNAGTANENVISGTGELHINGADIVNSHTINQGNIKIVSGSLTSNADLLASANGITNNADLIFNGGKNSNAISGTGALEITGDVTNNAAVTQDDLTVSSGMFTTNADSLTITNGITNNAGITFTGGTNDEDIAGTGVTYIEGTVTNAGDISTDIQINADANLGTLTDIVSTVENRGTIQLVDSDITSTGRIKGTGVVNILGDTTNNNRIAGSTVNVTAGSHLTTDSTKVEASIVNDGTLTWTAGTANDNALSGSGELEITGGDIVNNVAISQGNITISGGSLTSNADLLVSANGITNNADLAFTGGTNANNVLGTGDLTTTGDVMSKGAITQATVTNNGNFTNDKGAITADIINTGNFTNDEGLITGDVTNTGVFVSQGDFVIGDILNNGTYTISEGDNANDIIGTGSLEISGATINTGTIDQNDITVGLNGEFVASDISDITTLAGIDNTGILEFQSGNNTNVITGNTGALKVTGAVTNASGVSITQDTLNVATLGDFTADAGDLNTVNGITNTGSLTLGDGNTANNISGTGALTVTGTVNNTGNIEQQTLTNSGVFTSNADLLAFAGGITNTNKLDLTGGTNANAITGTGTTDFTGDAVNNATIEQATVTNSANLTNNGAITADFTNSGIVDNTAAITGAITNMGTGVIYSTADNLAGTIDNDGTIDVAGGTVQDTISGTGDMVISADLINTQSITQGTVNNSAYMVNSGAITATAGGFTNSGTVDNTGTITGDITNGGELNSSATNLVGDITNTGTLNLEGGVTQGNISSVGETNITADLVNNHTINQTTVSNSASLTNNNTITADDIVNSGTITGKASDLVAANEIANSGTLVFDAASTGDSKITGTGDVEVLADTILTGANTYAGGTLIDGADLTVAGQNNIGTGDVSFSNNGSLIVTDAGTLTSNLKGNTAADNINVENAAALTLSGSIGAAADFNKAGAGTMTFTMASNSYTGDTYVDAGTLIGNTKNINNAVIGAAGTTIEFNDTADAQLNEINTAGTFVQSATGVLNVENNAFTANQVEVNSGIFAANRAITADTLNVNSGATLRGRGNITGNVNVNSGATLAPGNSIDTLTVTGDLNLASGSTTAIEINETPASDKVIVTGNANITDGANLTVSNENGRYFEWKTFDIMEAGAVNGEFTYDGTVTNYDTSRIEVFADYSDPTKVVLTAKRKATEYAKNDAHRDLSRNQQQVAQAIDNISTGYDGDITNALLQVEKLNGLNPTEVTLINPNSTFESALNDLGGVMYANAALTSLFNAKTAHVYDRIAKRNPSTGACPTCHDNVWVEYYNQYDKVYANENSPRFTNTMSGALVGYDRSSDKVLLGVYGGFGKSDLRQSADTMDIDDTTFGVYAGYMPNENWIFKGTVYGGYQSYEGKRYISFMDRNTNSHYKGWNVAVDLEGGYQVAVASWVNIKPFVGVLSNYSHQQAFTERSADSLNLHVGANDRVHTQGRLGVQFDGKVGSRFNWYASAAVKQFFGDDYAKLHMSWELPNTEMTIRSAELGRTYFSGQVGVSYNITESLSVFGNLDTGVNNKSANCYGNLGLAYTW